MSKQLALEICNRNHLTVKNLEYISNGRVNHVYVVNRQFVIRIPRKGRKVDYALEQKAYRLVSDVLPLPSIIRVGKVDHTPYMLQTFLKGELWLETKHFETHSALYEAAGNLLKKIHKKRFSYVADSDLKPCRDWDGLFRKMMRGEVEKLPRQLRQKIPQVPIIRDDSKRVVFLFDFNEGNILLDGEKISGVIDFADTRIVPERFSLIILLEEWFDYQLSGNIAESFIEGYGKMPDLCTRDGTWYRLYFAIWAYNKFRLHKAKYRQRILEIVTVLTFS